MNFTRKFSFPIGIALSQLLALGTFATGVGVIDGVPTLAQQRSRVMPTALPRERLKEFLDDYTNSISTDNDFDRPRHQDHKHSSILSQVDSKAIRAMIRAFADNTTQLTYVLNEQSDQLPGLRQLYQESLRLSGTASAMHKRVEKNGVDSGILDDLQQLDADWHEFVYRIENVRGLSDDARELIANVNDADKKIRQSIGIQQQLDRRQLNLKVAALIADLENLQEDVTAELGNSGNAQQYRRGTSRARQAALNLISSIRDERAESTQIIEDYKTFEGIWTPLATKLRTEDDRYIERGVRRVAAVVNDTHQLLLLPKQLDQSQLVFQVRSLKKDIDEFFERTPLILVMQLPNAKQALPAADQFYGSCARLIEVANHSQDQNQILEAFRKVEQAERAFNEIYKEIDSDKAIAVLTRIVRSTDALRSSLQIQRDEFDHKNAEHLAASIQNITDQITLVSRRWLDNDNQPFADACLQEAADLAESAARLHDDIVDGRRPDDMNVNMQDVYDRWRRVYGYLIKCETDERPVLGRLSSRLTPAIVELRSTITQ